MITIRFYKNHIQCGASRHDISLYRFLNDINVQKIILESYAHTRIRLSLDTSEQEDAVDASIYTQLNDILRRHGITAVSEKSAFRLQTHLKPVAIIAVILIITGITIGSLFRSYHTLSFERHRLQQSLAQQHRTLAHLQKIRSGRIETPLAETAKQNITLVSRLQTLLALPIVINKMEITAKTARINGVVLREDIAAFATRMEENTRSGGVSVRTLRFVQTGSHALYDGEFHYEP